jgi:hypothetical protein
MVLFVIEIARPYFFVIDRGCGAAAGQCRLLLSPKASGARSCQCEFIVAIRAIFLLRDHLFNCFSRVMAARTSVQCS